MRADIEYAPSFVYFANEKTGRIRNSLAGIATGEIIDNFFFLEGVGRIYQGALSPLGPVPSDTATLSR